MNIIPKLLRKEMLVTAWLPVAFCYAQAADPPRITHVQPTPAGTQLGWTSGGTNVNYTVQTRDGLGEALWLIPPATNPWPVAETAWVEPAPATNATRYYRVVAVPAAQRGKVLSLQTGLTLNTALIQTLFNAAGVPLAPQYPVRMFKAVYETVDPLGARTVASAAVVLPQGTTNALPLASYQHGTLTLTNDAPSGSISTIFITDELGIGVAFATSGYAAVLPDYLGLGDSPGLHPYHHARSEATAGVDALRAARAVCASNSVPLNGQVFLTGYSHGGHVTMALHRELETFHTNEFTITASAPMAGAYDLSGVTTEDMLSGRPQPNPYYFAYLLAAYQEVYHLAPTFGDLLAPPYDTTLPPLFNGNTSGGQINDAMPTDPLQILKPELFAAFQTNQNHILRAALRDNDVYAWTPRRPMRLYHCAGDQDVVIANSQTAYASFQARGATQVQLIDPLPTGDHGDCVMPSLLQAKAWFDSLRQ